MVLTAAENAYVLQQVVNSLNTEFTTQNVKELQQYLGSTIIDNPIQNNTDYINNIANPMATIFDQIKNILSQYLNTTIYNNPYDSFTAYKNKTYLIVALYSVDGTVMWQSSVPYLNGPTANSFTNLTNSFIFGNRTQNNDISVFNANTFYSEMNTLLNSDISNVSSSMDYRISRQSVQYRACRKLYNETTGLFGGVLVAILYNPVINNLPVI
jgi:hypothetical protein